jgi:hypothetical protein
MLPMGESVFQRPAAWFEIPDRSNYTFEERITLARPHDEKKFMAVGQWGSPVEILLSPGSATHCRLSLLVLTIVKSTRSDKS